MARLKVWLSYWEHDCCGPERHLGDEVVMDVAKVEGKLFEVRHDYGDGTSTERVRGRLVGIEWHPAEVEYRGEVSSVVGYGPGVNVASTAGDLPIQEPWAFEFTVAASGPAPFEDGSGSRGL